MRLADCCVFLIALVGCLAVGCSRSNPEPSPLPVVSVPGDASPGLRAALEGLPSPDPKRRSLSVQQIGEAAATGESVTPILLQCLGDPNHLVRMRVVQVLGTLDDQAAIPPLIDRLKDPSEDRDVRARAAESLGKLEATEAVEPLVAAMDDMFWHIRYDAIVALGRIGDRRAEAVLQRAFEYDPDFDNRETAKQVLTRWQAEDAESRDGGSGA